VLKTDKRHWLSLPPTALLSIGAFALYFTIPHAAGLVYNSMAALVGVCILVLSAFLYRHKDGDRMVDFVGIMVGIVMIVFHVGRILIGVC
jgi:hypothetical protein